MKIPTIGNLFLSLLNILSPLLINKRISQPVIRAEGQKAGALIVQPAARRLIKGVTPHPMDNQRALIGYTISAHILPVKIKCSCLHHIARTVENKGTFHKLLSYQVIFS